MDQLPYGIYRVRRRKLRGPGRHYGVLSVSVLTPGAVDIIDLNWKGQFRHWSSLEDWAQGEAWEVVDQCPEHEIGAPVERMRAAIEENLGYDLLTNNCEHFASWVVVGKRRSGQVRLALGGVAVLAGAYLLARQIAKPGGERGPSKPRGPA